jgi:L-ascorbate metabolism protein UlaG (beta-lactamase superfamily)
MRVKWLGHSCFLLTSDSGTRILTDPYTPGQLGLSYGPITESADIVLCSHEHPDHNNVAAVKGNPLVIKGPGSKEAKGIKFKGIPAYHDEDRGSKRGNDIVFVFELDGMRICHLGDLGHDLSESEVKEIGRVDILFIPVGGFYTFEPPVAVRVSDRLKPRVVVPMHFLTAKVDTATFGGIIGPDEFLKGKSGVSRSNASEVEFKAGTLGPSTRYVVLTPAA